MKYLSLIHGPSFLSGMLAAVLLELLLAWLFAAWIGRGLR